MFRNGRLFAIHTDHPGTPRVMTNDVNKPVWQWPYSAFGSTKPTGVLKATARPKNAMANQPVMLKATQPVQRFDLRYPGQYDDPQTGTFQNGWRSYDYRIRGGYTQMDAIGLADGPNGYIYANQNPLMFADPLGLWAVGDSLPQPVVDFSAGLGDALLLGTGGYFRDMTGVNGGVDQCSDAYDYGAIAALASGGGRMAYAGLAKAGSLLASSGAQASAFRSGLKTVFRGGMGSNWRPPNLAGKTDAQLRASAGKTNVGVNGYGAGVGTAGAMGAAQCGCPR